MLSRVKSRAFPAANEFTRQTFFARGWCRGKQNTAEAGGFFVCGSAEKTWPQVAAGSESLRRVHGQGRDPGGAVRRGAEAKFHLRSLRVVRLYPKWHTRELLVQMDHPWGVLVVCFVLVGGGRGTCPLLKSMHLFHNNLADNFFRIKECLASFLATCCSRRFAIASGED